MHAGVRANGYALLASDPLEEPDLESLDFDDPESEDEPEPDEPDELDESDDDEEEEEEVDSFDFSLDAPFDEDRLSVL
ncbi:MAG TPA: hypothetical protein VGP92_08435 [Acidimicrobiia bacterium]|nr:hypothetical protein [Acidimicrobiia bacterium]